MEDGCKALNFSEWHGNRGEGAQDAAESVAEGSMPPVYYTWFGLHRAAKLTRTERDELVRGLNASLAGRR